MDRRQKDRRLGAGFSWPIAAIAIALAAMMLFVSSRFATSVDEQSLAREQEVVTNGLAEYQSEIGRRVVPQVVWDEAVINLDNRFSPEWAADNVALFLSQTGGFDETFVLDSDNQVVFAGDDGAPTSSALYDRYAEAVAPILSRLRQAESGRGRAAEDIRADRISPPLQASSVAWVGDNIQILTGTVVQSDFGRATIQHPRAPIVVTAMTIDDEVIQHFASRFMLADVHVHQGDASFEPDQAHARILDLQGRDIATLDWTPQTPGAAIAHHARMPVLIAIATLLAALFFFYRRSRTMAQSLIASQAHATHLAHYDGLTGLPNRVKCIERLTEALACAREGAGGSVAVLYIDLDRFKEINDTLGHQAGDELIRVAASRLTEAVGAEAMLARMSGDEFVVVLTDVSEQRAASAADRCAMVMAAPIDVGGARMAVGCSVGVVMCADADADPLELLRRADLALNAAKREGRGRHRMFTPDLDQVLRTRRQIEGELRLALAENMLEVFYQPQVSREGGLAGVEALLRWRHSTRGWVSPAIFIPVAEECGLIHELGAFVLRRAFRDARRWKGLKVAVNVSASQLRRPTFAREVEDMCADMRVKPSQFELEITEGVFVGEDDVIEANLERLRQLGFALALDDFGTGYSTLSYLKRLPISKIKIDRSFITNLGLDRDADAVVAAIVRLARALGLSVIAEGVETEAQRERLLQIGCNDAQGFLFGTAVTAEAINTMVHPPTAKAA